MRAGIIWLLLSVMIFCLSACSDTAGTATSSESAASESASTEAPAASESASTEAPAASEEADSEGTSSDTPVYADIEIEGYGTITVALDPEAAPRTVENFVKLAEEGFYDGLTFHRIMEGFMMQGGDPTGTGMGGSDETLVGEFADNGYDNPISHVRGTISMARSNDPDSASSQFFIVQEDSTFLDGAYAGFGTVTDGMDIVDAICEAAQPTDNNGTISAADQPVITSVTIREA